MKSKCSFVLKTLTALVLVFLLLFGTVATPLAAVVDDLANTGDKTVFWIKGTDVGSNWTENGSGIQFNSAGWASFSTSDTNAVFKVYSTSGTNGGWKGCGTTLSAYDTEYTCYGDGGNGHVGFGAGEYALQIAEGEDNYWNIKLKLFPVYNLTESTVYYFNFNDWWSKNEPTYMYVEFLKPDGSLYKVPAYRLDSYLADNSDLTTVPNGNASTGNACTHFAILPAGKYIGLNYLKRKSDNSADGSDRNYHGLLQYYDSSYNINSTAFTGSNSFAFDSTKKVDPEVTVKVDGESSASIYTNGSATLSAEVTANGDLSAVDSYAYTVTSANAASANITNGVFTASAAGTYTVRATATYHAKGFSSITDTVDSDNTVTITVSEATTPYISDFITSNPTTICIGETVSFSTTVNNAASTTVNYSVTEGTSGTDYSLSKASFVATDSTPDTMIFTGKQPGTYTVNAAIAGQSAQTVTITVKSPAISTFTYSPSTIYAGADYYKATPSVTMDTTTYAGGSQVSAYSYTVSSGDTYGSIANSADGIVAPHASNTGDVTVTVSATVTNNGCSYTATKTATVTVASLPTVFFDYHYYGNETDRGPTMTYDSTATSTLGDGHVVYKLASSGLGDYYSLTKNTNFYVNINVGGSAEGKRASGESTTTSVPLGSGGAQFTSSTGYYTFTTLNKDNAADKYVFYYDIITDKFYVEYPVEVKYSYVKTSGTTAGTYRTEMVAYKGTPTDYPVTGVTGYQHAVDFFSNRFWYTTNNTASGTRFDADFSTPLTSDLEIFAKMTPISYTVTLDDNGGSGGSGSRTATYDATPSSVTVPTRTGYTFLGYYDADDDDIEDEGASEPGVQYFGSNGAGTIAWDKTANTTLYAHWAEVRGGATYSSGANGTLTVGSTEDLISGTLSSIGIFTYQTMTAVPDAGYNFDLWTITDTGDANDLVIKDTSDVVIYTGGAWTSEAARKTATIRVYTNGTATITDNVTIAASFVAKQATITFNFNGGVGTNPGSKTATYGSTLPAYDQSAPTKTGYNFAGYKYSDTTYYASDLTPATWNVDTESSVTLTAQWTAKTTAVTVDYTGTGHGDAGTTSTTATYDSAMVTLAAAPTSATGYTYQGIYDSVDTTGTKYYNTDGTSAHNWDKEDASVTLYAVWTENKPAITVEAHTNDSVAADTTGGTVTKASVSAGITTADSVAVASTTLGYAFAGWTLSGTDEEIAKVSLYTDAGCSIPYVEGGLNNTVYIKTDGSASISVTLKANFLYQYAITLDTSYTTDGSDSAAGPGTVVGYAAAEDGAVTYTTSFSVGYDRSIYLAADEEFELTVSGVTYKHRFIGWYSGGVEVSTDRVYQITHVIANASYTAKYKRLYEFTTYPSYIWDYTIDKTAEQAGDAWCDDNGDAVPGAAGYYVRKAAAPASYSFDGGTTKTAYTAGSTVYVPAGDTVTFFYTNLASSEMIKAVREDPDNTYIDSNPNISHFTLDGSDGYGYAGDEISSSKYSYNRSTQALSFAMTSNLEHHKNMTVVLQEKLQIVINNNDYSGIEITGLNSEGYYFPEETVGGSGAAEIRVALEAASDKTYYFTGTTSVKDGSGEAMGGFTVTAYEAEGDEAEGDDDVLYYTISSASMPSENVYISIGVGEKYRMYLSNAVISDTTANKVMITQSNDSSQNDGTDPAPDVSEDTTVIGSISAIVDPNAEGEGLDISTDEEDHWVYPSTSVVYEDNPNAGNNYYLAGGVNKTGTLVSKGSKVVYKLEFLHGNETLYSFVGWYAGTVSGGQLVPNYNKKLGTNPEKYTCTPEANTVVFAVVTRDMYLGGNFTLTDGVLQMNNSYDTPTDYNPTAHTWKQGRIKMNYDPTYVKPGESTKRGRYYYTISKDAFVFNSSYHFRVYDNQSGSYNTGLTAWNYWSDSEYNRKLNNTGESDKISTDDSADSGRWWSPNKDTGKSVGWFMLTDRDVDADAVTDDFWLAQGYDAPLTIYFYAYDGGISIESTYLWSKAFVSPGVGVFVTNASAVIAGATATFNSPSVEVANKTTGDKDVIVNEVDFGDEKDVQVCTVKENDGEIEITADTGHASVDVEAFLVYNLKTKDSYAIKDSDITRVGETNQYKTHVTIPGNARYYIVPIYKFTDEYMEASLDDEDENNNMAQHTVYFNLDDISKDSWGGLVGMYSWGTTAGFSSGTFPGQLMIPTGTDKKFYATLQYLEGGLAGVSFNNYCKTSGDSEYNKDNFLARYYYYTPSGGGATKDSERCCATPYNLGMNQMVTYDYREPISILYNIDNQLYEDEDMDLNFSLKPGNKIGNMLSTGAEYGTNTVASVENWEYLMNRAKTKRVDLNGQEINTNPAASYYVVCYYTQAYKSGGTSTYSFAPSTHNQYSIEWYVYSANNLNGAAIAHDLSAAYTDMHSGTFMTEIATKLDALGYAVTGKSVKIAYEDPVFVNGSTRYSGQWYADGTNVPVDVKVRTGVFDGESIYTPLESNNAGFAIATLSVTLLQEGKGELVETEAGCSGNSHAIVTRKRAGSGHVTLSVDTTENFVGWFYLDKNDDDNPYKPVGGNNTSADITVSFTEDMTYYAFYSAKASYVFQYKDRSGNYKNYIVSGKNLDSAELADDGRLNVSGRLAEAAAALSGMNDISVFNRSITFALAAGDNSTPYTLIYRSTSDIETPFTLTVYNYQGNINPEYAGTVTGSFSTAVDLYTSSVGGENASLITTKPSDAPDSVFIGWREYDESTDEFVGDVISTNANFGYSLYRDMTIAPYFGTEGQYATLRTDTWKTYIDANEVSAELTAPSTGTLYNDTLIAYRNAEYTPTQFDLDDANNECGILIFVQANNADDDQKTAFDGITKANMESTARKMVRGGMTSAKIGTDTYGDAYAIRVKATSLSRLNRVDICQRLDYAKFNGGKYKLISYAKIGDVYYYSDAYYSTSLVKGVKTPVA